MLRYSVIKQVVRGSTRWGYSVLGADRRHRIYVHPETKRPFRTRGDVQQWIRLLESRDRGRSYHVVRDVAAWIFAEGSPWIERQARKRDGRSLSPRTIAEHKQHVDAYILDRWGDTDPGEISAPDIEEWLYAIDGVSNRYRAAIWVTFRFILEEFARRGVIRGVPKIEQPRGSARKKTALTMDQLAALFPDNHDALRAIWGDLRDWPEKGPKPYRDEWLKLAAVSALMFFGGLRPQEARAVCADQLYLDAGGLTVTRQTTDANEVVDYLKAADARDPRYRYALLPKYAVDLVSHWCDVLGPSWLLFPRASGDEGPITNDHLYKRIRKAFERSGLDLRAGRFTPYSGRYTWRTQFAPRLDPSTAREVMGHRDDATHQSYNVPELADRIRDSQAVREALDRVWDG